MSSKEEIKEFYDLATIRKLHGFVYTNSRVEYAWQTLNSIFEYRAPEKIFEIGSGIGEISYRLAEKYKNSEVLGFDISDRSIEIATKLFVLPNLSFVRSNRISELELSQNEKFDIIFLMDVYEHIPVDERPGLNKFIRENMSNDGYVFFSCPTPAHLKDLRANNPSEIQPVDEDISMNVLLEFANETSLNLIYYKEVSVWRSGDYFHAIFTNRRVMQHFSDFKETTKIKSIGLKKEILKRAQTMMSDKTNETNDYFIKKRMDLIRKRLGQEMLDRIISFKQ